jgi:hypothetical protein
MEPEGGFAEIVLPTVVDLVFRDCFQVLLVKTGPTDQMPFVDLARAIEAGIEERGQGDNAWGQGVALGKEREAKADDDLGRTEIDLARRNGQGAAAEKGTSDDGHRDRERMRVGS